MIRKIIILVLAGLIMVLNGIAFAENKTVLDIETAGTIALKNNPSMKSIKERIFQAEETVKQARANFMPSLDASGTLSRTDYSENSGFTDLDEYYSTELSATWTLFSGFSKTLAFQSAKYSRMSEKESGNNLRRLLLLSVAQSYSNVQLAIENINTAKADITYFQKLLLDAKVKRRAGSGSLSDVLSFQVQVNSSEASLIDSEKEYKIAITGLAALMGYGNAILPAGIKLTSLESGIDKKQDLPDLNKLIELSLDNRPDLKQLDYSVKQADKSIGIAKSGYYPTVSVYGTWNAARADDTSFENDDYGNTAGVTVSFNIFSGGSTISKVSEAKAAKREAALGLTEQKIAVKEEIITAYYELDNAKKQLELQKSSTALVKRNRDLIEAEYKAGNTSLVRLTEAQSDLIKTRSLYLKSAANLQLALEKIKAYTGVRTL
jgi:outer membrane protein TolC